jgi:TPP-dependent pyruvate/acetoin dehydrogenase alpha subunit
MSAQQRDLGQIYRQMLRIRYFEEKVYELFLRGVVPGTFHLYQGEEAIATGVCANLCPEDVITSTHRPHGHAIAKGVSLQSLMAEILGKETGCCRGWGGSMHVGDMSVGMVPAIGIVGAAIPMAAGIGLAFKLQRVERVAVCFFGDGAINTGAFHEGLNLATVWKLPVIFVCENNLYAISTPLSQVFCLPNIADRAQGYGLPGVVVDGNDVLAVLEAAEVAIKRAQQGDGPTLLECKTYRHKGHSRSDPARYRPPEEVEQWLAKDPIPRLRNHLVSNRLASDAELAILEQEVFTEVEEAARYAQESPLPDVARAMACA